MIEWVHQLFPFQTRNGLPLISQTDWKLFQNLTILRDENESMESTMSDFATFNSMPILSPQTPARTKHYYY